MKREEFKQKLIEKLEEENINFDSNAGMNGFIDDSFDSIFDCFIKAFNEVNYNVLGCECGGFSELTNIELTYECPTCGSYHVIAGETIEDDE